MPKPEPEPLHLRRIDAARNMRRFYALSTQPTLFGEMSLIRNWGRIGTSGKTMVQTFDGSAEAIEAFYAWSAPSGGAVTLSWTKNRLSLTIFEDYGSACDAGSICFAALMPDQAKSKQDGVRPMTTANEIAEKIAAENDLTNQPTIF